MPNPYQVTYEFSDADGDVATTQCNVPSTFTLAQYTEFARAMAVLKDAVTVGLLRAAKLVIGVDVSALLLNGINPVSDVEEVGAFQFTSAAGFPVIVNIPGIDESNVGSGSDDLNQADADVAAFITAMTGGIAVTGGTISPCDVAESDLTTLVFARENFRASGRRR